MSLSDYGGGGAPLADLKTYFPAYCSEHNQGIRSNETTSPSMTRTSMGGRERVLGAMLLGSCSFCSSGTRSGPWSAGKMRPRDRKNRGFPLSRNWKTALTVAGQPNGPIGCLERAVGVLKQPMAELSWSFLSASFDQPESPRREATRRRQAVETLLQRQAQGSGARRWGAGPCSRRTSRARAGGAVRRAARLEFFAF